MERCVGPRTRIVWAGLFLAMGLVPAIGCQGILTTAMYVSGAGDVPAECDALAGKRVVVLCQLPASDEFSFPGAGRDISREVSNLLAIHVKGIDVVSQSNVDNWLDVGDGENFKELAAAVDAQIVVHIELANYDLRKGPTLYQGQSEVDLAVYDIENGGNLVWQKHLGEILFPVHSAVPIQEKPLSSFHRQYVQIVASRIARNFYSYEPTADFAIDATAIP